MSLTLQNMRDAVRNRLDLDTTDLPDTVVDQMIRRGWRQVIRRVKRWPFMERSGTFNTTNGTAAYALTTIGSNVEEVIDVVGPNYRLRAISPEKAEQIWMPGTSNRGVPGYWTRWNNNLTLYPTPGGTYAMTFRYYEKPIDWIAGGSSSTDSQLPDDFQDLVLVWAIQEAHAQQEDLDLATYQKNLFEEGLETLRKNFEHKLQDEINVLNGGVTPSPWGVMERLRYSWE